MTTKDAVLKAITYRVVAFVIGTVILVALTGPLLVAPLTMAVIELISTAWYCLHDRLWKKWRQRK